MGGYGQKDSNIMTEEKILPLEEMFAYV